MVKMDLTLVFLIVAIVSPSLALQCKDESGKDVDWYVVYKLPRESDADKQATLSGRTGFNYAYITSDNYKDGWKISSKTVKDEESLWGQTLAPAYKDASKYTYAIWNDAPSEGKESGTKAHSKGVIVMDKSTGFYIVHSVPKFVNLFSGSYGYPDSGRDNGQASLCISFDTQTEGPKLASHLLLMKPNLYSTQLVDGIPSEATDFTNLFNSKYRSKDTTKNLETEITTLGGTIFRAFSKSPKDLVELYGAIVAPALKAPLYAETWRRGAGGILESDCTLNYKVNNVVGLQIDFDSSSSSGDWEFNSDHSKWAISADDSKVTYTCIGDVNRMASQAKRGGGTLCFDNEQVHKAFRSAIQTIEPCSADSNGESQSTAVKTKKEI